MLNYIVHLGPHNFYFVFLFYSTFNEAFALLFLKVEFKQLPQP